MSLISYAHDFEGVMLWHRRRTQHHRPQPLLLARPDAPTLFIECTHTYHSDLNTGIQRVVRNVLRNAAASAARYQHTVVPVILEGDRFVHADIDRVLADKSRAASPNADSSAGDDPSLARNGWRTLLRVLSVILPFAPVQRFLFASPDRFGLAWCVLLPLRALRLRPWPRRGTERSGPITLDDYSSCDHSVLVLLDSSWTFPIWPAVERFRRRGGKVVGVVYDLIPITHPHTSMPNLTAAFGAWLKQHVRNTEALIGISRSTADQLARFIDTLNHGSNTLYCQPAIDYFHLGSELDLVAGDDEPRPQIRRIFDVDHHIFLMVGSFEPRKNHGYALDAFDAHWSRGGDAALVMIGRQAWKTDAFLDRVARHEQLGRRLFLIRDATDTELDYAYRNASALIIASEIEGFGLPVVEAFQRGLPVLCSDIPVFREIAEGKATFFDIARPDHLAEALMEFCRSHDVAQRGARTPQGWITWRESTDQLCAAIMHALNRPTAPTEARTG
jgi:alpha-1,2-rhamnosyltransferase